MTTNKSKLNFGNLFGGGGGKRASVHGASPNIGTRTGSKKWDRQMSFNPDGTPDIKSSKKKLSEDLTKDKRAAFVQTRSSTGLNLVGNRRKSVAVTDETLSDALRSARSHLDLSQLAPLPGKVPHPAPEKSPKAKVSFKDRSWTEIERLWRGKAKEPPNIEAMMKPRSSFRTKDRSARSKTIPPGSEKSTGYIPGMPFITTTPCSARSTPRSGSPVSRLRPPASAATLKAVDLMAPHVLQEWQEQQGCGKASLGFQRHSSVNDKGTEFHSQHFEDLVDCW